jgi:hypothetical protein
MFRCSYCGHEKCVRSARGIGFPSNLATLPFLQLEVSCLKKNNLLFHVATDMEV